MAFTSYLSYTEYQQLGGKVPEESFNVLERKAQRLLDYITFARVPECPEVPEEVKEVLEKSWMCDIKDILSSIEEKPLGSASIAQVHKAVLLHGKYLLYLQVLQNLALKKIEYYHNTLARI